MENPTSLCPVSATLSVIGGKWKPILLWNIRQQPCHFSEFLRRIPPLSQKVLTQHLRQMERDGLISRTVLDENPPRVMYALTEQGTTLLPLLEKVAEWGANYQAQQLGHQRATAPS